MKACKACQHSTYQPGPTFMADLWICEVYGDEDGVLVAGDEYCDSYEEREE